jgi:hypothetical protein
MIATFLLQRFPRILSSFPSSLPEFTPNFGSDTS